MHVTRDTSITINCIGNDSTVFYDSGSGIISGTIFIDTTASKTNLLPSQDVTILLLEGDNLIAAKLGSNQIISFQQ